MPPLACGAHIGASKAHSDLHAVQDAFFVGQAMAQSLTREGAHAWLEAPIAYILDVYIQRADFAHRHAVRQHAARLTANSSIRGFETRRCCSQDLSPAPFTLLCTLRHSGPGPHPKTCCQMRARLVFNWPLQLRWCHLLSHHALHLWLCLLSMQVHGLDGIIQQLVSVPCMRARSSIRSVMHGLAPSFMPAPLPQLFSISIRNAFLRNFVLNVTRTGLASKPDMYWLCCGLEWP